MTRCDESRRKAAPGVEFLVPDVGGQKEVARSLQRETAGVAGGEAEEGLMERSPASIDRGGKDVPNMTSSGELHPLVLALARGQNFAALTTLLPSGHPQTQVMWVDADGDHLLVNTEVHRQKFRNVERDPRVTLMIWDKEDPYRFVEVRGEVVEKVKGPEARKHIDELSQKYRGGLYRTRIRSERVVLRIAPLRQVIRIPS
jgi:PPOX class probable F420-dependent enzyme